MQSELDSTVTARPIQILGVNAITEAAGNPTITAGHTIPWLQDTPTANVWQTWAVTFRDVVILDPENMKVGVYNLTTYNLADSANYAHLKSLLLSAAAAAAP